MDRVKRYCQLLGVAADAPAEEMEQAYVALLQELNSRQAALAGDQAARDAVEQQLRDLMEAYAYLSRLHHATAPQPDSQSLPMEPEHVETAAEAVVENAEPAAVPETEPPKLVSEGQLQLLFRVARILLAIALFAIILARCSAHRNGGQSGEAPAVVAPEPVLSVVSSTQAPLSTAAAVGQTKEVTGEARRTLPSRKPSRGGEFPLKGRVTAVTAAGDYLYLRLQLRQGEAWVAVPTTEAVRAGDRIEAPEGPQLLNYRSSVLGRTLDRIVFVNRYRLNGRLVVKGGRGSP